jgi:lysine 2,3-aminomutase
VDRHSCGLDEDVVAQREVNRERILGFYGATRRDWERADWQAHHVLKGEDGARILQALVPLTSEELAAVRLAVRYHVPWGITPYYLSLFDFDSVDRRRDAQVRSQVIPPVHTVRAMIEHRGDRRETFDFMRERDTSPIERITRRYPTVAIFKVCGTCPQVCVYCQRNWEIADAMVSSGIPSREAFEPPLAWFEEHCAITDVLLTGGDPLVLEDHEIAYLLRRLSAIEHIRHVRIGTRVPVTMPMRVTERLADLLGGAMSAGRRDVSVVTHVESAHEVTPDLASAVERLRRRGVRVYNQQVMTLEASRRFQPSATRIALKRAGIDPYYTFYAKGKDEHRDYLVPIARLLQERKEEARLLPGIFRTDEPVFNVPGLGKSHLRAGQDRELIVIRPDGRRVYLFHPWEKAIAPVAPWPYVDVAISEYLKRLEAIGEHREDYASIWYYR